jgi:sec-independent protein translocase protein TatC
VPRLIITDPVEGLSTRVRIAMYGGLLFALPVIMWQIWRFVVPALKSSEKKYAIPFIVSSVSLFLLGCVIAYLTLEKALQFLISWAGEDVESLFQVSKYIRLVTLMAFAFGVGFQFPVLLVFLQLVGVLSPQQLLGAWRYAIVGIVVVAAVITPSGDPISLAALAVPMLLLYFVAAGIGVVAQRRSRARERVAAT